MVFVAQVIDKREKLDSFENELKSLMWVICDYMRLVHVITLMWLMHENWT